MSDLGDIVQEFLVESHENLDQLDRDLVALEAQPGSRELLSSIFRTIHTIKGTSGFLAFHRLEKVTHVGESLLSRLRDGAQEMTPATTDALLRMVDTVRGLLAEIEENGQELPGDDSEVVAAVNACITDDAAKAATPAAPAATATPATPATDATPAASAPDAAAAGTPVVEGVPVVIEGTPVVVEPPAEVVVVQPVVAIVEVPATPQPAAATPQPSAGPAATPAVQPSATPGATAAVQPSATPGATAAAVQPSATPAAQSPATAAAPAAGTQQPAAAVQEKPGSQKPPTPPAGAKGAPEPGEEGTSRRSVADQSIRVDVDLLDKLMNLVGELVLTRNQLVRAIGTVSDPGMTRTGQRLNLITSELQESVMKTRMQAIDHIWSKLPRVVRDLSSTFGKQIKLAQEGKETELDRSLLEAVKDPLTHLVRNAVDHGIETPADRVAAGKPAEGTLTLRAYHEGGHVIVEVRDDGSGIDPDKIARIAVEKGIVSRDQLAAMDKREILGLVFKPGFSTAKAVTNVSGRGVGMDVVKTNIERIGGAVDVDSVVGKGTTWRLTIPLTLAIIQALTIECAQERYVIPQVAVHELVYLDGQSGRVVEHAMGAPVYRLRGKLLPLVYLDETLGVAHGGEHDTDVYVAVLQAEGKRFGLVVDRVLNTEEVVVKPLTSRFKDIGVYAGATLLGDGRVALILDVASLARRAHLAASGERENAEATVRRGGGNADRLLIAGVGDRRVAIPLDMVTRLEEFPVERIERTGSREVVQYRDQILPVLRLSHLLGAYETEAGPTVPVVVYTENGRSVALAVEKIIDIVEEGLDDSKRDFGDDGLLGSAVIQQRVTELLDVRRAILAADPLFHTSMDPYEQYQTGTDADYTSSYQTAGA
ncbi:chemotaxis protein CheW [Dactylosporangium sp. CS-047395]|uniref:chemotaxis protein CheW n=1 Tax=Dactylosporangium sp. CS-047395 TaxID=3239936 RepID=UPI003D906FAE